VYFSKSDQKLKAKSL